MVHFIKTTYMCNGFPDLMSFHYVQVLWNIQTESWTKELTWTGKI